jgi:hypothetical protein
MLTALTKKLCPFISLAIATIGCGKKTIEKETLPETQTQNQQKPSAYLIQLDANQSSRMQYKLDGAANFEIPNYIFVRAGDSAGKKVEIAFGVNQYNSTDYEFKCFYSTSSNPGLMVLTSCVDYYNEDYGNTTGQRFRLYTNDIIQIRFVGAPAQGLFVEIIFNMEWF